MNTEMNEIPENLTVDDLVNFLMPYSKGVYTAEDYQNILNSPLSTHEKNSMLYVIGIQVAKEEEQYLEMLQFIIQYEAQQLQRYRMNKSEKKVSAAGRSTGKSIYWKAPIDMKQYEMRFLDESALKQSHVNLLNATHIHSRAYHDYHLATRQALFKIGVDCFRAMDDAGVLVGDPAQLANELMHTMMEAPSIPKIVEQLTKNQVAVTSDQANTKATMCDEIRMFAAAFENCDKEKMAEYDKQTLDENDHTKKPSSIRGAIKFMKNSGMKEHVTKNLEGLKKVSDTIESGNTADGQISQVLNELVQSNKIFSNWIQGGMLDAPANTAGLTLQQDKPMSKTG